MRRLVTSVLTVIALLATGVVAGHAIGGTGTVDPPPRIAFLANGINPADAVAGGSIAGQLGAPVFTTRPDTLEDAARSGIVAYGPELVIVLGGPGAISDDVLLALSDATGLAIVPASASTPQAGITRVAGATRYDTAAAVADLVAAYAPAYLPVAATALEATELSPSPYTAVVAGWAPTIFGSVAGVVTSWPTGDELEADSGTSGLAANFAGSLPLLYGQSGHPRSRLLDVTLCFSSGSAVTSVALSVSGAGDVFLEDTHSGSDIDNGAGCQTFSPSSDTVLDASRRVRLTLSIQEGETVSVQSAWVRLEPTEDPLAPTQPVP